MLSNIIGSNLLSSASSTIATNACKHIRYIDFCQFKIFEINIFLVNEWTAVEKKNLINLFKMVVKELIQLNLNGRTIDDKSTHFLYFFDVFENIIDHGIKSN